MPVSRRLFPAALVLVTARVEPVPEDDLLPAVQTAAEAAHVDGLSGRPGLLQPVVLGALARRLRGLSRARLVNQTYGRWVVRFRMPRGSGVGMDVALRPSGGGAVVDWIEESSDKGAARAIETATLHAGSTRVHAHVSADFTRWHTMILAWTPGHITVRIGHHHRYR